MAREFKLPDIGEGVHEGEVVKWFVKEGDPIRENDPVVEVMTDKVTVQIPSPVTGKVLQLRAKEGEVVKVGATLVVFGEDGEAPPATPFAPAARPTSSAPPPAPTRASVPPPPPPSYGEALAAPAVRRLAKELNVNLGAIRGSGPQGRILEDDVRRAAAQASAVAPAATISRPAPAPQAVRPAVPQAASSGARGGEERIPIHGLRKRIFEKMAKSNVTAAHFTYVDEADKKDLWGLAKEIERLSNTAREKKLALEDVLGSTFTITSLGKEGGVFATPIINWPEVGILGIHKIEKRPVVRNDQIVVRDMMYLSCSFDHRVVDGHVGAAFVQLIRNSLEHPALLFVGLE